MRFRRVPARIAGVGSAVVFSVVCCLLSVIGIDDAALATAQSDGSTRTVFNIPAQPLNAALFAYAQVTGAEVFVDDALIAGRRSASIRGTYDTETALRALLSGSGLEIRNAASNAFTLVLSSTPEPPFDQVPGWSSDREQVRFYAAVQTAVRHVLCKQSDTQLGLYRAALAVWVDPAGTISQIRLLSPNVNTEFGRALLTGIEGTFIGEPPPAGLPQPVTFVILPRTPESTGDCMSAPKAGD